MDVQDDIFDTKEAGVNKIASGIDQAVIIYLADCNTTTQTRYVLLAIYVLLVLINAFSDVRWSIVRGLSLILLWFCFYNKGDFSLISLHGSYLITKMALMTLGNASIWVTIPGVRFDSWSIVMGNLELAAYLLSWAALVLASWIVRYCARPFQRFPALQQAVIATIIVLVVVVAIDKATSSTGRQRMPSHDLDNEQQASEAEIDYNRVAIYEKGGEISSGKIIRLLRLLPLTEGERVHCEIVNRDLDKASGDYEAVSYTWGEMKEQAIIEIDGRPIRVSRKIFEMLRVLRQTWKPRLLWIDNICINQVDTNEKSHQITLMRHIYYRANSVIIWLDPSPDTAIAIDLLKEISLSRGLTGVQGAHLYGQRDQRHRLLALARLIGNEYFNRLWVVQEIASARKIQVLCGDQSIRWDDLTFVLIFMGNPEMLRSLQRTEDMGVVACDQDSLRHANTILNTKSSVSRGVSSSLAFVLCNFRSLKCKDPRDKVFGILGLVRNTDHPLIHPDYNKTEIQVYKDVAKYVFTVENTSRKLLALPFAGVGHCRRLQELPSWVPDWAANMRRKRGEGDDEDQVDDVLSPSQYTFSYLIQPLSNYGNHTDIMEAGEFDFKPTSLRRGYQAALDTGVEIKLVSEDVLSIRGFVVDEIQSLTSIFDIPFDDTMRISHTIMTLAMLGWFEEAEALAKTVPTPYPTGQPIEEVVWRTMIGDRLLEEDDSHVVRPAPDDYGQVYENYKHAATGLRRACSLLSMEVVSEMRDIYQEMFTQLIGGGSVFKVLVEVLCGRSGHSNVWALISRRTKFAGNDTLRPEFPQESGDNQFWAERLEELGENEETKSLVAVLFALFRLYSPEQPSNVSDASRGDPVHGSRQDGSTEAAETDLSQLASLAPAVSRFPEGLRLSFERRLCTTKNGYIGLVPPLTRVGDIVSIFHGGDAPYLVRPEADPAVGKEIGVLRCRLVGECYMHGMMDGEMIRPEPEPEPERTPLWFHLT
ncbi:heterokaryon incompatibility protein-domain-containing protein [Xylaria sp. FL0933]|nr:heterokaryon incompatibility protein-domain-containing protein [Xylaria sp. FL0933]